MRKKGFTLIELLVVISIISLISSLVISSVRASKAKSRDARRMSDFNQIKIALELYYSDKGYYPQINYAYTTADADSCGYSDRWCALENELKPYLSKLPRDPLGLQNNYVYYYDSDSGDNYSTYGMMCRFEDSSNYSKVIYDGGYYNSTSNYFEIGQQPGYCMNAGYATTNRNWWGSQTTVCVGGN